MHPLKAFAIAMSLAFFIVFNAHAYIALKEAGMEHLNSFVTFNNYGMLSLMTFMILCNSHSHGGK